MFMTLHRPLSPHLTIYKPQLTSMLSIFHRITGAFMATSVLLTIFLLKICNFHLTSYNFYIFAFILFSYYKWLILTVLFLLIISLHYHMSNGLRHLTWDLGLSLDIAKVYSSGRFVLVGGTILLIINLLRFLYS
uniref:Succinate:cytochrome c oxidoreductase subunit 3 n=1 Tax=Chlorokybus atmophyticus TaxID=3144 RepID=A6YE87_CHLAT|nr:succinate:cytochrome c oxidoreductase subunit 3 [Chlorokybus atmophyticus]ABO15125.1 succinate:cytochrome c oxidoreductase subunit 3 [Chlorokybus atmophyticus]